MTPDDTFDRLAERDTELHLIAARGRRRALVLLVVVMASATALNLYVNQTDAVAQLAVFIPAYVGSISYSWSKWRRHPEDTQSIAFLGLSRARRRAAYRSLRTRSPIDDPVVLTMVESMHEHQARTCALMIAAVVAVAGSGVALTGMSGDRTGTAAAIAIVVVAASAIAQQRWLTHRAGEVIGRSRTVNLG